MDVLLLLLTEYDRSLTDNPILTKIVTASVVLLLGDMLAQYIEFRYRKHPSTGTSVDLSAPYRSHFRFDKKRICRFMLFGGPLMTPLVHMWYNLLEQLVPPGTPYGVIRKIFLDQLVWTPPANVYFFYTINLMETLAPQLAWASVCKNLWPTLRINWVVWPLIHTVTFTVVPVPYRVLFVNFFSLFWGIFLSLMANKKSTASSSDRCSINA